MSYRRIAGLLRNKDGFVVITTPEDLAQVLACPTRELSSESIEFQHPNWETESQAERAASDHFLSWAINQVCSAGRLRNPNHELPPLGARAEAIVFGKPGPPSKYGVGTITSHGWDSVFRCWRMGVIFDEITGYFYGGPIRSTSTFPRLVHVVGSGGRPFSTMSPNEIDAYYLTVRPFLADT